MTVRIKRNGYIWHTHKVKQTGLWGCGRESSQGCHLWWARGEAGGESEKFGVEHVAFEVPLGHPNADVQLQCNIE